MKNKMTVQSSAMGRRLCSQQEEFFMVRNDKGVFEELCKLTVQALGSDVELPVFSLNYRDRWVELIQFWEDNYLDSEGSGLLCPVLVKMRWGYYPRNSYSESQKKIFELLENEIRTNIKAHRTWIKSEVFVSAFDGSVEYGPGFYSYIHFEYATYRTDDEILPVEFYHRNRDKKPWYKEYEEIVQRLLPGAAIWSRNDWLRGDVIFDGLKEKFAMDYFLYGNDPDDDYAALIKVLEKTWIKNEDVSLTEVLNIRTCSEKLAAMIWTVDMKKQLVNMFAEAVELAREGKINANVIKSSWLYCQVQAWYRDGCLDADLYKVAKETVFHVVTALT